MENLAVKLTPSKRTKQNQERQVAVFAELLATSSTICPTIWRNTLRSIATMESGTQRCSIFVNEAIECSMELFEGILDDSTHRRPYTIGLYNAIDSIL